MRRRRKTVIGLEGADVTCCGQTVPSRPTAAATEKARSQTADSGIGLPYTIPYSFNLKKNLPEHKKYNNALWFMMK